MSKRLCMGCMNERGDEISCPHCGYMEGTLHFSTYLAPGTMLVDRYLVGKVLSYNGEGVSYIGYDTVTERRVKIREFFPEQLAARAGNGMSVEPFSDRRIQYKAYLSDFTEIFQKLARMRTVTCLARVYGIEEANNTVYAITEFVEGPTLRKYLERKGAMLTYAETCELLMPIIKTIRLVHEEGLIHRGLSVDTLILSKNSGLLKIDGFAISSVRAAHTELPPELYPGFSAPEQYTAVNPHGKWTDVYALSAILYTCLTGRAPTEALIRSDDHPLASPRERNQTVPVSAAEGIVRGLALPIAERIPDIASLLETVQPEVPRGGEAPTRPIKIQRSAVNYKPPKPPQRTKPAENPPVKPQPARRTLPPMQVTFGLDAEKRESGRLFLWSVLISFGVLLVILLIVFIIVFAQGSRQNPNSFLTNDDWMISDDYLGGSSDQTASTDTSDSSVGQLTPVGNFIGEEYEKVSTDPAYRGVYVFRLGEEVYHEEYKAGVIVGQDIREGTLVAEKPTEITLKVSKGSRYLNLPNYQKVKQEDYEMILQELEIPYLITYQENTSYPAGYVVEIKGALLADGRYDISNKGTLELIVSLD